MFLSDHLGFGGSVWNAPRFHQTESTAHNRAEPDRTSGRNGGTPGLSTAGARDNVSAELWFTEGNRGAARLRALLVKECVPDGSEAVCSECKTYASVYQIAGSDNDPRERLFAFGIKLPLVE